MDLEQLGLGGVLALKGLWEDADGRVHAIEEMSEDYKWNVVRHILKCIRGHSKYQDGYLEFGFKGSYSIANKLRQLGCSVIEVGDEVYKVKDISRESPRMGKMLLFGNKQHQ